LVAKSAAAWTMSRTSASTFFRSSSLASFFSMDAHAHLLDRIVRGAHLLHFLAVRYFARSDIRWPR